MKSGTNTASPGPTPQAMSISARASVPLPQVTQCFTPTYRASRSSSALTFAPPIKPAEAMTSAASRYAADDLVTTRYHSGRLGALWGVLRVVFLTVLGTLIGLAAAVAYGQMDSLSLIAASSAVKSLVGALLLELCTSLFDLPDRVFWLILWVLIAATLCTRTTAAARRSPDRSRRQVRPSRSRGRSSRNVGTF